MTQLSEAVDAIHHYTGTDVEKERILDLALPTMQYNANRFHRNNPRLIIDVSDLVAYQQLYLLQWLQGERPAVINQSFLSGILYNHMITFVRMEYRDFRRQEKYYEFVNQCFIEHSNEYLDDCVMSDMRITLDELDVKAIVKDILFKLLIDQYSPIDVKDYYGLSLTRIMQLFDEGMTALCQKFKLEPKQHFSPPNRQSKYRRSLDGKYVDPIVPLIITDYRCGMTYNQLSIKYRKARSTIIKLIDKYGVEIRLYEDRPQKKAA